MRCRNLNQANSLRSNNRAPVVLKLERFGRSEREQVDGGKGDLCRHGDLQRRRLLGPSEHGGGSQRHNLKPQLFWVVLASDSVAETWGLSYFEPQPKMNLTLTKYCFKFLLNLILFCGSNYKDLKLNEKKLFLFIIFEKLFFFSLEQYQMRDGIGNVWIFPPLKVFDWSKY